MRRGEGMMIEGEEVMMIGIDRPGHF